MAKSRNYSPEFKREQFRPLFGEGEKMTTLGVRIPPSWTKAIDQLRGDSTRTEFAREAIKTAIDKAKGEDKCS